MSLVKRIVLDVLKPHHPSAIEFSQAIAEVGDDYRVCYPLLRWMKRLKLCK